ncbi:2,3-dihydro-2,3-dihydroxybenzoate dehydrogenase [Micromonospora pisi]|uniref:2,3-dihydro-2,3-dihydroxybenzoate dehydrogenase n=1 Tax=Micromonospora pisi TaxID=589240 RepID=A0A495JMZ9_9ACTN|nr:2,3-dihydro-2,3-dihydroxybenzoate dehydrogenase [Micromonospora pisi]RKR90386.1 2,3-dihydro-2,3-dihydroxybenzoate dehydrogenase [Micromonospora pisi]
MELMNRVAIVTGAAQGIGAAVARALVEGGARVAVVDVNEDGLDRLVAEFARSGLPVRPYCVDVRDASGVEMVAKRVEQEMGPVSILVNVAGVLRTGPVVDLSEDDWETVFAVNTTGVFHFCRAVSRLMVEHGGGSIITVSSNAAGVPRMHMSAYASSKAASTMFTKCLGLELAEYNVRCNVVAPGSTYTEMQRSMWGDTDGAQAVIDGSPATFRVGIPLRRLAEPADIADAVVFLVSDRARHITMQDLYVDGGAALRA